MSYTLQIITQPPVAEGVFSVNTTTGGATVAAPRIDFTPAANFAGTSVGVYTITDAFGQVSNNANITVTVSDSTQPDVVAYTAGTAGHIVNVLANDTYSGVGVVTIGTAPTHVTATVNGSNEVVLDPIAGDYFIGAVTMTYQVDGGTAETITINIGLPTAPVAVDDTGTVAANSATPVTIEVSVNDTFVDF
jgi:hypothetical protein